VNPNLFRKKLRGNPHGTLGEVGNKKPWG